MTTCGAIPSRARPFPDGRLLTVTWGVPDQFGGMTSALLHRSRAFVRIAGRPVDVLTFDVRPDTAAVHDRLEQSGELVPGMRLRNLYEDLRATTPMPGSIRWEPRGVTPGGSHGGEVVVVEASDGSTLVERLRDGRRALVRAPLRLGAGAACLRSV